MAMTYNFIFFQTLFELFQKVRLQMAAEWMDFSFVTGTESIHGDKHVDPENINAVDCNLRSPIIGNGSFSHWPLFFSF